ncbi:hypothetical protein PHMEG_00010016 [Phytophthora megakarya]|uniref:Uncharacterized protein n=1 Tax=Phytophthora megakarya TaxID=4795 RepID=A0A225WER8_9STRA|nr:hypothetical protein PHMEG_00010016 [Phytophthora megakarya]
MLNCKQAGIILSGTPVFMDYGKAGISAGATLGLQLHFCTRHFDVNVLSCVSMEFLIATLFRCSPQPSISTLYMTVLMTATL